jgi:hypothetical protein
MTRFFRWSLGTMLALFAAAATAEFHTFVIDELYSNADGTVQYIVLHESAGMDGENLLGGQKLTSTSASGTKTYTFTGNLPGGICMGYYGCTPSPTANKRVLIATAGFLALGLVTPNYIIPSGFLAADGGTVNYASVDSITYTALPNDGTTALNRDGTTGLNVATNFAGATASVVLPGSQTVTVVEYYNQGLDHYFITALASDEDLLDRGVLPGWARTGETFNAYPTQAPASLVAVCRFFIPPEHGSSHFFSAKAADCAFLLAAAADPAHNPSFSGYVEEDTAAFYVTLPDGTGACPPGTLPVFRLWNQRFDSNHRYTTKQSIVSQMEARNFVIEGDPPNLAAMCAAM